MTDERPPGGIAVLLYGKRYKGSQQIKGVTENRSRHEER